MDVNVICKFVSFKVNKIRWLNALQENFSELDTFVAGSWDNEVNTLSVWKFDLSRNVPTKDEGYTGWEPSLLCSNPHFGMVSDILSLNEKQFVAASSTGSVTMYSLNMTDKKLSLEYEWTQLHGCDEACSGLAAQADDEVVTVGENGVINVLRLGQRLPLTTVAGADSTSLNAVCSLHRQQVAVVNSMGQLKVWDLRQQYQRPASILSTGTSLAALFCVDRHPSQPHTVAAGGQDGMLAVWDLRHEKFPITLLSGHSATMWELHFHPLHPDHLFSCSQDGSLWHWNSCGSPVSNFGGLAPKTGGLGVYASGSSMDVEEMSSWLGGDAVRHRLEVTTLLSPNCLSVNSLDVAGSTLLCGTDGEQIFAVRNLTVI